MRATMGDEFEAALGRNPDKIAVEYGGARLSYSDLDRWSAAIAHQLIAGGVGPGDVVAIYMRNCAAFVATDVAVARLGAVKLPINFMLPASTVGYALEHANATVVVTGTSVAGTFTEAVASHAGLARVEVYDGAGILDPSVTALVSPPAAGEPVEPLPARVVDADDPAAVYFTGGTTGKPKGVVHSQRSTVALHYAQLLEAEIHQDERMLLMTPLAHASGLFAQSGLIRGATCVIEDGFDAERAVALLRGSEISWTFLVPTMIYRILDVLGAGEPAGSVLALRTIVYGAAPISPRRLRAALDAFGPVFIQLYGQTESPNWGTRLAKSDHDLDRPELLGSCGRASIAADVRVIGEDGEPLVPGQVGEIWLKTAYLMTDYLGSAQDTAEKFVAGGIRTGDIGVLDEDGYLYLRDRKNDMVISGGMNVYCREVEDVLGAHAGVAAVAVIGVPHEDWGESVHAVVVPGADGLAADELLAWARSRLASYARPKSVDVVETLPETPFGKIDKKALREPYWAGATRGIG